MQSSFWSLFILGVLVCWVQFMNLVSGFSGWSPLNVKDDSNICVIPLDVKDVVMALFKGFLFAFWIYVKFIELLFLMIRLGESRRSLLSFHSILASWFKAPLPAKYIYWRLSPLFSLGDLCITQNCRVCYVLLRTKQYYWLDFPFAEKFCSS